MMKKTIDSQRLTKAILFMSLFGGALVFIFPIVWTLLNSVKSPAEISAYPPTFFPQKLTFANYKRVLFELNFGRFFLNSAFVTIVKTSIILYTSAFIGYILGKIQFRGRNVIFIFILTTMMFPYPVLMVVLYNMVIEFGWLNNYLALIVPFCLSGFGIFLMRQFVTTISDDVIDSAKIDGASQLTIFHTIIIPQMGPAVSALGIFVFLAVWDDLLWPYLVLTQEKLFTIPVGLTLLRGYNYTDTAGIIAASSVTMIPTLIVFLFAQRRFIEGMTFTGVKG